MVRARNMPTPEQQYQAGQQRAWLDENAKTLATRDDMRRSNGASRADLDRHLPLTPRPAPITDKPKPKKRRWRS